MNKNLFLVLLSFVVVFTAVFCGLSGGMYSLPKTNNSTTNMTSENTKATNKTIATTVTTKPTTATKKYKITSKSPIKISKGNCKVISLSNDEQNQLVEWTSSDKKIAVVDSGGRVDAVSVGKATVCAELKNNKKIECTVSVVKSTKSEYDGFSTCIIANSDKLKENKSKNSDKNLYYIKVNRQMNCVTVYTYDSNGLYTVPVRAMVCSCGTDYKTILGDYNVYFKTKWLALVDDVFGYYVSGISGDYLFHSVPYYSQSESSLEVEEYNKLGDFASLGCVRMASADSKWIYNNCPEGTQISIFDSSESGPLGKPEPIKITDSSCGWDPTDSDINNPYYSKKPVISGVSSCTISKNGVFSELGGVSAVDTCGNDITDKITVTGNVITSKSGKYKVTYSVEDVMHRKTKKDIVITIK